MSQYWKHRFEMLEDARNKTAKQTVNSITPAFDQAQAQIEKEINAWYTRFAKNNEISLQEAKKLLNTKELKEFRWDVQEYIKYGRENAIDQKWMKELENASARFHISRLEALKVRTQNAAERAFGNELDQIDQMATKIYMDDYYHTAYEIQKGLGIGWDVSQIDQKKLDKILSKPWTTDKQTFSDRIWKSKTQLIDSLHTELTQMCVLGKSPDQTINTIANKMNVSKGQAGRLVMTEATYFGSVAQKDCFNDLDVEKYEVVATLDNRTSDVCQQMDGQVFDMKDFQAGVTAPPFHVWCRSCTAPWFPDDDDGTRVARGEDGQTYQVPASMKYQDWKDHFVDKTKDPADWLKKATVEDVVESVKKFVPTKTIEEAEEYARRFVSTIQDKWSGNVSYKGLSVESANTINQTLNELYSNGKLPTLRNIKPMNFRESIWKGCEDTPMAYRNMGDGDLHFNPKILKNKKSIDAYFNEGEKAYKFCVENLDKFSGSKRELIETYIKAGRSLVAHDTTDRLSALVQHEMGHHIENQIMWKDKTVVQIVKDGFDKYSIHISGYATKTRGEYIAESFCAFINGESDRIDPMLKKYFEGLMKR